MGYRPAPNPPPRSGFRSEADRLHYEAEMDSFLAPTRDTNGFIARTILAFLIVPPSVVFILACGTGMIGR